MGFLGSNPYERLATIYHKQQNYTDEIRSIFFNRALEMAKKLKEKQ